MGEAGGLGVSEPGGNLTDGEAGGRKHLDGEGVAHFVEQRTVGGAFAVKVASQGAAVDMQVTGDDVHGGRIGGAAEQARADLGRGPAPGASLLDELAALALAQLGGGLVGLREWFVKEASWEGRLLSAPAVHELGRVQTPARDRALRLRVRWRLGYHQAVSIGARAPKAFGHYGYGGSGGWADPTTGLSLGFVTNKIGWRTTPIGDARPFRLTGLALEAAKETLDEHQR